MTASSTKFSPLPGAHERHLQRKCNNPLFPNADQYLLAEEIVQARSKDTQDLQAFLTAFEESVQQAAKLSGSVDADVVLELKHELERLYVHSTSLAGDLSQYREALQKLLHVCMATIEKGAGDDVIAIQKLKDEVQARQVFFNLLETHLVADLIRGDEIIQASELIPTLLSETAQNLMQVLEIFDQEQIKQLIRQAHEFINGLPASTLASSQCQQRLVDMERYLD